MVFYLRILFWSLVALIFGAFLHYVLPQWDVVRITDTYNRVVNMGGTNTMFWSNGEAGTTATDSRDVLFIETAKPDGDPMVYRNEDTGLGWPPMLKFDTADLQAEASNLKSTSDAPKWVAIKNYGWRIKYLSTYPNALKVKEVAGPAVTVIAWSSVAWLVGIIMVIWAITARWLKFKRRHISPVLDRGDAWMDRMWLKLRGREPDVIYRKEI